MKLKICRLNDSFEIFTFQIVNMEVRSEIALLLFLICLEDVLSASVRTVDLISETNHDIGNIVQNKIRSMNGVVGVNVEVKDVKFIIHASEDGNVNPTKSLSYVFFLIHGWTQNAASCPWYRPLTELLLKKFPTAWVVQVDYGKAAAGEYESAVVSSEGIGLVIAHIIHKMVKEGVPVGKILLIGHSLGAQMAGWVGKDYRSLANQSLPRIIAMDPAGPIFIQQPDTRRLNKYDADVVIVIHSDIKQFGFPTNCGTIDFYPNGGTDQSGCPKVNLKNSTSPEMNDGVWCNHRRAKDIFIAAFKNPQKFMATQCNTYEDYKNSKCDRNRKVSLGDWETTATGSYYLRVTGYVPLIN